MAKKKATSEAAVEVELTAEQTTQPAPKPGKTSKPKKYARGMFKKEAAYREALKLGLQYAGGKTSATEVNATLAQLCELASRAVYGGAGKFNTRLAAAFDDGYGEPIVAISEGGVPYLPDGPKPTGTYTATREKGSSNGNRLTAEERLAVIADF